jgi:hypothetical protein
MGADVLPLLLDCDCDFCASSELIIPGEGALANLPMDGIAVIGCAFVTTTSLLDFLDALLLR